MICHRIAFNLPSGCPSIHVDFPKIDFCTGPEFNLLTTPGKLFSVCPLRNVVRLPQVRIVNPSPLSCESDIYRGDIKRCKMSPMHISMKVEDCEFGIRGNLPAIVPYDLHELNMIFTYDRRKDKRPGRVCMSKASSYDSCTQCLRLFNTRLTVGCPYSYQPFNNVGAITVYYSRYTNCLEKIKFKITFKGNVRCSRGPTGMTGPEGPQGVTCPEHTKFTITRFDIINNKGGNCTKPIVTVGTYVNPQVNIFGNAMMTAFYHTFIEGCEPQSLDGLWLWWQNNVIIVSNYEPDLNIVHASIPSSPGLFLYKKFFSVQDNDVRQYIDQMYARMSSLI